MRACASRMSYTRRTVVAASAALLAPTPASAAVAWRTLSPGLEHGQTQIASTIGDRQLHIVRIDPAHNRFVLLTSAATNATPRTARQWASENNLLAATNAGMFRANRLPVGFAKVSGRVIQPTLTSDRSIFTFDGDSAHLLDTECETFDASAHDNALQSIRMISCTGRNVWSQQPRIWSTACIAEDASGKILFLHARSPLSVHDFIDAIRALPLDLARAMYLEGGPEATLFARGAAGSAAIERFGSYETGFNENDDNTVAWPLPNIIGVVARG
jgi:uncharacterized protein YigE (DUF2233 family)